MENVPTIYWNMKNIPMVAQLSKTKIKEIQKAIRAEIDANFKKKTRFGEHTSYHFHIPSTITTKYFFSFVVMAIDKDPLLRKFVTFGTWPNFNYFYSVNSEYFFQFPEFEDINKIQARPLLKYAQYCKRVLKLVLQDIETEVDGEHSFYDHKHNNYLLHMRLVAHIPEKFIRIAVRSSPFRCYIRFYSNTIDHRLLYVVRTDYFLKYKKSSVL